MSDTSPINAAPLETDTAARADATDVVEDADGMLVFACPRCHRRTSEDLYGPCAECRTTLRAVIGGEAREVDSAEYVPKMNVTPNAVATKD